MTWQHASGRGRLRSGSGLAPLCVRYNWDGVCCLNRAVADK
jgi:hypothetical protein